jgi:hypothetical protein
VEAVQEILLVTVRLVEEAVALLALVQTLVSEWAVMVVRVFPHQLLDRL